MTASLHRELLRRVPTAHEIYSPDSALSAEEREEAEKRFFYSLRLKDGTRKFTYPRRLDDLNELVRRLLPPDRPLEVMDVGISSGVTTVEWLDDLRRAGVDCRMMAGDSTLDAFLLSFGKRLRVLLDSSGYPLQFDVFGRAVPNPPGRRRTALYFLPLLLIKKALPLYFDPARRTCTERAATGFLGKSFTVSCERVKLVSPRLEWPPNVELVEDDIISGPGVRKRFHVIRAANVLNTLYFDEDTLARMLTNLRERLLPGGLLVLCKTEDEGTNHATVFALGEGARLGVMARLGGGSDLEGLVRRLNEQR